MLSLLQFDWPVLVAIVGVMLLSGLVHGSLGLGFPMVATPILATMMDIRTAILITLLPTMAVNVASIVNSKSSLKSTRVFLPLVGFALIGSVIGSGILAIVDPAPFRALLAGLILLYLMNNLRIPAAWLEANSLLAMVLFGLAAGFSAGTTNVMVAVLLIYFLSLQTPRDTMVPALNSCFLVGKLSQIVVLSAAGLVSLQLVIETTPLALAAVLALLIGQKIRHRIKVETYQSMLRVLLLVLAIILIVQFVRETGLLNNT